MKALNLILGFAIALISVYSCKTEEIIVYGDISGTIIDAETTDPIQDAKATLLQAEMELDSTNSDADGSYLLNNIEPGDYEVQITKPTYEKATKNTPVTARVTITLDFELDKASFSEIKPKWLDFGLESTEQYFTIKNSGVGQVDYSISTNLSWINIEPKEGEVTTESDTIRVTINRDEMPEGKIEEEINILTYVNEGTIHEKVAIYANGISDVEGNYYGIVTIGTQVWMAESLNTGKMITWSLESRTSDDEIIEKYCYDNLEEHCNTYGGWYSWDEMMDYEPEDEGEVGTTQGICPDGWHLPTYLEVRELINYLGGSSAAGGKLKATGTLEEGTGLWKAPNTGATNESGFTALPSGGTDSFPPYGFNYMGEIGGFLSASGRNAYWQLSYNNSGLSPFSDDDEINPAGPVRCIKDSE